jgi:hypothetical protein
LNTHDIKRLVLELESQCEELELQIDEFMAGLDDKFCTISNTIGHILHEIEEKGSGGLPNTISVKFDNVPMLGKDCAKVLIKNLEKHPEVQSANLIKSTYKIIKKKKTPWWKRIWK